MHSRSHVGYLAEASVSLSPMAELQILSVKYTGGEQKICAVFHPLKKSKIYETSHCFELEIF